MGYAKSFKELIVYKRAFKVAETIFEISKNFPKEEKYSLTDQMRRSSRSIGAQIAEAWGKRRYEKHFISKLTDADSEQLETQHWIEVAGSCGYIDIEKTRALLNDLKEIRRMLQSMITKSKLFCVKPSEVNEELAEYITSEQFKKVISYR